jgi:hypothetical protein
VGRPVGPADQHMRRSVVFVLAENQETLPDQWMKRIPDHDFARRTPGTMSPLPMLAAIVPPPSMP